MIIIHLARVAILIALLTAGILGIFAVPVDHSTTWYSDLILSKLLGASCIWTFHKLYETWKKTDDWFIAYDEWCKKADDTPRPNQPE